MQNSDGADMMVLDDSKEVSFKGRSGFYNGVFIVENNHTKTQGNAIIGVYATPTARLQVKGSGTTSATTSLLVQNSAGTDMLKVTDNKKLTFIGQFDLLYNNSFGIVKDTQSLTLKDYTINNQIYTAPTFKSVLYSDAASGGFVGINNTAPTAQLHLKGSGNDATTTALLVQNSAGTDLLNVTDDGFVNTHQTLIVNHPTNSSRSLRLGWGSIFATDNASELNIGAVYSQNTAPRIVLGGKTRASGADAVLVQALNGMYLSTTASTEDPSAQLHIKGSGTTSATTALLVQNSAGTDLLKVNDDNNVIVASIRAVGNLRLGASGTDRYYLTSAQIHPLGNQDLGRDNSTSYHWNNVYSTGITHITDNTTSSTTLDASAKLQVDSTTQGFLPPRMTDAERDAIATPAAGLMIYDTTNNQMNYWNGSTWIAF